ncbi:MAG: hypothetical protein DRP54_04695 [Spirochaetes bacterium]|nr:MAG: hypothetical protein DRP54_04695 [Spirochaetota bacterium]
MGKKIIAITGASGFVGSSILKYLKNKGFEVLGLVRERSSLEKLKGCENNTIKVNLKNRESIEKAIEGSYCVIHCAARSLDWGKRKDFLEANVNLTENVANACKNMKIPKLILLSTANVAGYGEKMKDENESEKTKLKFMYSKTKLLAEKRAIEITEQSKTSLVILRPSAIYGPGDTKWSFEMLKMIEKGKWPILNNGKSRFTPLFIENLCHAIDNVLRIDFKNYKSHVPTFNITDDIVVSWIEFCNIIAEKMNVEPSYREIPFGVALTISAIIQCFCGLTGYILEPPLTLYRAIRAGRDFLYTCDRAKKEIDYCPDRNIETHIEKTVKWYRNITDHWRNG